MINFIEGILAGIREWITSRLMLILLKLKGVQFQSGLRFFGFAKFTKVRNGSITIGKNSTFRSYATSNLIGVNRPCIVSAIGNDKPIVEIGNNCGFSGTVIGAFNKIVLGNNVRCGANTLITDSDWHLDDPRSGKPSPVYIADNVWLGVNVMVLKGVSIGENTIIGANSVVTKDIPANVVAAGNPCKVLKKIDIYESTGSI
jgi:acetyltransferase-like isoleucine patch superfamily enzyme